MGKFYSGWGQGSQPHNKHRSHISLPSLTRQKFTRGNITSLMNCLQPPHGEMKLSFMSLQRSMQTTVCEGTFQLWNLSGVSCGKDEIVTEVWFAAIYESLKGLYLTKLSEKKCTSKNMASFYTAFGESYSHHLFCPMWTHKRTWSRRIKNVVCNPAPSPAEVIFNHLIHILGDGENQVYSCRAKT